MNSKKPWHIKIPYDDEHVFLSGLATGSIIGFWILITVMWVA